MTCVLIWRDRNARIIAKGDLGEVREATVYTLQYTINSKEVRHLPLDEISEIFVGLQLTPNSVQPNTASSLDGPLCCILHLKLH